MIETASPDSSTAAYLRQATKQEHHLTEKTLSSAKIMRSDLSRSEYACLLQTNYAMWATAAETVLSDGVTKLWPYHPLAVRLKEAAREDLLALGEQLPAINQALPSHADQASKMGIAYVLLGSGLGAGMMISRLRKCPELQGLDVFRFYSASGALTMKEWQAFRGLLDDAVKIEEDRARALSAANETFRSFRSCYSLNTK